ncbi:PR-1-like protein [Teratosphaeria nubilosa]|uniref:PR-1-like protein n=1 Tax=Teratosphaeria nubilosa TaxID=161662 RepID=A0A6G1LH99_9PEZI|nr:PR-1-like protein [Teratosphaeria nubilosa]
MRSAVVAAAFAAGAIAVPSPHKAHRHAHNKREIVTDVDIAYVTNVVTVWADASTEAPYTYSTPASSSVSDNDQWAGHGGGENSYWTSSWTSAETSAYTSTYTSEAQSTQAPSSSTYVAPSSYETPSSAASTTPAASSYQAPSSTSAAAGAESSPTTYDGYVTYHHNLHRTNHTVDALAWNQTLADIAGDIANTCVYQHNLTAGGGGYGQNIAAGVAADNVSAIITDLFYNGEVGWYADLYGQDQPDMTHFELWGHFSQLVWKETRTVGCATVDCSSKGLADVGSDVSPVFTVCNYYPPGNYQNDYGDNVIAPPNPNTTATWDTWWESVPVN